MGRYSTDAGFGSTNYPGPLLVHNNGHNDSGPVPRPLSRPFPGLPSALLVYL